MASSDNADLIGWSIFGGMVSTYPAIRLIRNPQLSDTSRPLSLCVRTANRYSCPVAESGMQRQNNKLTPSQQEAVAARGNVLVMAGAGTGKTHTLVERCLDLICNDRVSLDEMLIVTFTEAAATEMRERLREGLENAINQKPDDGHLPEQLALFDAAHLGTLHGFCFKLIRGHFHALG